MFEAHDLLVMLRAYIDGDLLARKVVVDLLEEAGDPRAEAVRQEAIHWDGLARRLAGLPERPSRRRRLRGPFNQSLPEPVLSGEAAYLRFLIECARFGSPTRRDVAEAVRDARQTWAAALFPELAW